MSEYDPREAWKRVGEHLSFILSDGPSLPPVCVLCGVEQPNASGQYGSTVYYDGPYDGFQCRKCTRPIMGYSGCEGCHLPLGPMPAKDAIMEDEGLTLRFHDHCLSDEQEEGVRVVKETWSEMLLRWAEDLESQKEFG